MDTQPAPSVVLDLTVRADHGQIYIYSPQGLADADNDSFNVYLDALEDAVASRRFVGTAGTLVDLMTPGQRNSRTPMRIEVWPGEPPETVTDWDHEVDVDLDVPDGQLLFVASGGTGVVTSQIPAGRYRARVSGRGYDQLGANGADGNDAYRLQLWPRAEDIDPALRKYWQGWDAYQ